ncbi:MaoC family dehydratase [Pararhodospirillum photometricum]|uniref:MaoC-like dehydratase n=1 Tax=Pararhodospirillum photometricum DSM 122 TaxID=1150469 RepID=H6SJU8_PARPM|nr:MaoC family dehydratase [Pararhodospirillum photometricum]CCG08263.1 MaoC-like dehydratase [Pararhodospirillum photometricum DSM 122]
MSKTNSGHFFEDFALGQELVHATPRTVSTGDVALHTALYGPRLALHASTPFAQALGYREAPLDDFMVFHVVFGKTVPDISLNAVANLGYARGRFGVPVYPGDTLSATSTVIGRKETSSGKTGVVYVNTVGSNQHGAMVCDYVRWVMVNKRDPASPAPEAVVPELPERVAPESFVVPEGVSFAGYDTTRSGSPHLWDDYTVGERIDHVDGMTIEEAEHMMATRLWQNTAKVHFNQYEQASGRFGRRLVYGGHVISLARSLSFNGLENAVRVAGLNGGLHCNPTFAGDTIHAWSEVLESVPLPGRDDVGALRLRTVATKDRPCGSFPYRDKEGRILPEVVLDLDYWILLPRRR